MGAVSLLQPPKNARTGGKSQELREAQGTEKGASAISQRRAQAFPQMIYSAAASSHLSPQHAGSWHWPLLKPTRRATGGRTSAFQKTLDSCTKSSEACIAQPWWIPRFSFSWTKQGREQWNDASASFQAVSRKLSAKKWFPPLLF